MDQHARPEQWRPNVGVRPLDSWHHNVRHFFKRPLLSKDLENEMTMQFTMLRTRLMTTMPAEREDITREMTDLWLCIRYVEHVKQQRRLQMALMLDQHGFTDELAHMIVPPEQ